MKHFRLLLSAIIVLLCTGFGQSTKDEAQQKHYLNYQGEVIDLKDKKYPVDNISISGRLRSIKMYDIPVDASRDPAENITAFDLEQIASLEPVQQEKCGKNHQYKNRRYIEVIVTLQGAQKGKHYLIDSSQKIMCDELSSAGSLERIFTIDAIKKLTIIGRTERHYNQLSPRTVACTREHLSEKE